MGEELEKARIAALVQGADADGQTNAARTMETVLEQVAAPKTEA